MALLVAMPRERRLVTRAFKGGGRPLLRHCGIGPERARIACERLLLHGSSGIASIGLVGALDADLRCGDVHLPERVKLGEREFPVDPVWHERALAQLGTGVGTGTLLTTGTPVGSASCKRALGRRWGADLVDMEAGAVAQICQAHGVPFLALKVVLDECELALPEALLASLDVNGRPAVGRLASGLMREPALVGTLLRLGRATWQAERALCSALRRLGPDLGAPPRRHALTTTERGE